MFIRIGQNRQEVLYQMKHYNVSECDRNAYKIPPPALKVINSNEIILYLKYSYLVLNAVFHLLSFLMWIILETC